MNRCLLLLALLASLLPPPAAAEEPALVAVMPLDVTHAQIDAASQLALEEDVRTVAGEALRPHGYTVLTGENTLRLLADNGIDPAKACDQTCALAAARELKAQLFISGTVTRSEGWYIAFVRLFEPGKGQQLAAVKMEGQRLRDLRAQYEREAPKFFSNVPQLAGHAAAGRGKGTAASTGDTAAAAYLQGSVASAPPVAGAVHVNFQPGEQGERWVLVSKEGVVCRLPCERWVAPKAGLKLKLEAARAEKIDTIAVPDDFGYTPGTRVDARALSRREAGWIWIVGWAASVVAGGAIGVAAVDESERTRGMVVGGLYGALFGSIPAGLLTLAMQRQAKLEIGLAPDAAP